MQLYTSYVDLSYGSIQKEFSNLYNIVLQERTNKPVNRGRNKILAIYDPNRHLANSRIEMQLLAKYIDIYRIITDKSTFYMKISRTSFHFSAKSKRPIRDKFICLKRMIIKIGKIKVNYRGKDKIVDDDEYFD